uniref:Secreted protein n=1 Tax=Macrostomum lignano TaxID=282301 RepID=A0A1I8IBH3_9PLAT
MRTLCLSTVLLFALILVLETSPSQGSPPTDRPMPDPKGVSQCIQKLKPFVQKMRAHEQETTEAPKSLDDLLQMDATTAAVASVGRHHFWWRQS